MPRRPDPDARRKLLEAARVAFADRGVDAARVEDIAHAAGLSKGAFYLHFESKDAVFHELVTMFFAVMHDLQVQRHDACTDLVARVGPMEGSDWTSWTPRRRAWADVDRDYSIRTLEAMWRQRDIMRIILDRAPDTLNRFIEVVRSLLVAQLDEAMRLGGLRPDLDPDLVSDLLIGAWLQLGRRMLRSPRKPDFEQWARTTDALLFEGLRQRDGLTHDQPVMKDTA